MLVPFQCLLAAAVAVTTVSGHGYMTKPACKFTATAGDPTQFIATIESSASGLSGTFNGAPSDNVAAYTKAFKASKYKSLKAFIDDKAKVTVTGATLTCGSCDPKQTAQPLPTTVEWSHSSSEGFTPSHEGPCEVWCDDTMAFHDDDCSANYKMVPAELPYKKASCSGASQLTFYWMAMHSSTWQVYVNCAPLEGGSGGSSNTTQTGSSGSTPSTGTSSQGGSTPATQAPSSGGSTPSTSAPSSGGSTPSTDAPASTPAPQTPSTPSTPSTGSGSDCGSLDVAGSSDCGSLDVAGSASDCGSLDVAGSASDCGSLDVAGGASDCGSLDVAGSGDGNQAYSGSKSNIDFSTIQGTTNAGTVAPQ